MRVRPGRSEEAEALADLAVRAIEAAAGGLYSEEEIREWAGKFTPEMVRSRIEERFFVVVESDCGVVGFGALGAGAGEIDLVYVSPGQSGLGHGRAIVDVLANELKRTGVERAWLDSSRNAVLFYESCGFARSSCGETKGGLCLRMEREL